MVFWNLLWADSGKKYILPFSVMHFEIVLIYLAPDTATYAHTLHYLTTWRKGTFFRYSDMICPIDEVQDPQKNTRGLLT